MKHSDIWQKQVYTTKMINRFKDGGDVLSPIYILDHTHGFVIFKRDEHKQAIQTKDFISTYIKACGYGLKKKQEYALSNTLPLKLVKKH